ncbi:hypothetical protein GCM10010392_26220 [Streptomyces clavifer]|uniref:Uncharacterized protein n=1 Tax=Streptomyces clavifer TaxID=68188 RepID=A0ABS4V8U2_9ACTN|nr:hypothetical protein [Streptomyces clavifer]GHA98326.1 hypothetical protein GCM10010392_26220 [Streptomyces clavifer]
MNPQPLVRPRASPQESPVDGPGPHGPSGFAARVGEAVPVRTGPPEDSLSG